MDIRWWSEKINVAYVWYSVICLPSLLIIVPVLFHDVREMKNVINPNLIWFMYEKVLHHFNLSLSFVFSLSLSLSLRSQKGNRSGENWICSHILCAFFWGWFVCFPLHKLIIQSDFCLRLFLCFNTSWAHISTRHNHLFCVHFAIAYFYYIVVVHSCIYCTIYRNGNRLCQENYVYCLICACLIMLYELQFCHSFEFFHFFVD